MSAQPMSVSDTPRGREAVRIIMDALGGGADDYVNQLALQFAGQDRDKVEEELAAIACELPRLMLAADTRMRPRIAHGVSIAVVDATRARLAEVSRIGFGQA